MLKEKFSGKKYRFLNLFDIPEVANVSLKSVSPIIINKVDRTKVD